MRDTLAVALTWAMKYNKTIVAVVAGGFSWYGRKYGVDLGVDEDTIDLILTFVILPLLVWWIPNKHNGQ